MRTVCVSISLYVLYLCYELLSRVQAVVRALCRSLRLRHWDREERDDI